MPSKLSPGNALTIRAQKWKHDQGIRSLTFDELLDTVKGKKYIAEQKVDGQSAIMEYEDGSASFGSLGGRIITDIPVLNEIEKILKDKVSKALMVGELAGVENGKIIHFDKTESLIKNPAKEKEALHWFPYQILELNGEEYKEGFGSYMKGWSELLSLFRGAKYVEPVKAKEGSIEDLKNFWNKIVEKEENEGLVVRTEDGKVYKSKPTFTYDLVVIAVGSKKGKNWPKKMIGNTLMAFMDEDHVFRIAGEIGTGWNDEEKRELFSWAQKNKVGEDNTYVWVKPEKIIEVQWERSNIRPGLAYRYSKNEYEKLEKRPVGTIVKPRFIRYRTDKSVNPKDLRLTQIPNWEKTKKMARIITARFIKSSMESAIHKIIPDLSGIKHITLLEKPYQSVQAPAQKTDMKPKGLWYSCGTEWIKWVLSEMPHWTKPYIYELHLNDANILKISNIGELKKFTKEYLTNPYPEIESTMYIDWQKVATKYDGIEICPYIYEGRMDESTEWYYGWDVASGCVWNSSGISEAKMLYEYDKGTDSYKESSKKRAHRVTSAWIKSSMTSAISTDIPENLQSAIHFAASKIKEKFGYTLPADIEWRTSDHPSFEKDYKESKKEKEGFITKDWKKIYIDLKKVKPKEYVEFAAHEIGHFFDRHLGNGSYFSMGVELPAPQKDTPPEAFAMMVAYMVTDNRPGGPNQTALYDFIDRMGR